MSIMASPFKHPQTGVYYFRMAIPKYLIPVIGKREFKSSLKTKNLSQAKQVFGSYLENAHKQLELAKLKLSGVSTIELTERDCAIIAERWYEFVKAEVDASGTFSSFLTYDRDPTGRVHEFGLSDTFPISGNEINLATQHQLKELSDCLKTFIVEQLDREGLYVPENSDSFLRLAVAFYHYVYRIESLCRARHQRNFGYDPITHRISESALSVSPSAPKLVSKNTRQPQNSISNVFKKYENSEVIKSKDAKTLIEVKLQIERLIEVIGDIDVTEVNRAHIVEFRDSLLQLPKSKANGIRNKTLSEQIELAKAHNLETLTATTAKNCMRKTSLVFSYAVELGLIAVNPQFGVRVTTATKMTEVGDDKGYIDSELSKLFKIDVFNDLNAPKLYGMACYWIPVLCRYTGARLEEIAQLNKSDISISNDGIHYINIRRGEGQSVKTNSSLRHIPLHDHLIELGFLDYVASSVGQLFPELKENKYGKKSASFSKWWSKTVKNAGVITTQPAHAFRHTLKTALRSLGVADTVSDAITGHTPVGVGGSYGSVELKTKKAALDRLTRLALNRLE